MDPFEVTKDMVSRLDDVALRELLSRLLEAEARQRGISQAAIAVGGNQTEADGGVDASIVWSDGPDPHGWLPRRTIFFQSKAESMAPAKLANEMRPKGIARPIFAQLASAGGAYIIFSTDNPSHLHEQDRLTAMRAALSDVQNGDAIELVFVGADRIARWVNSHIGVAMWVLEEAGHARGGWRPYGSWSAEGAESRPYLIDEEHRAAVGDDDTDMTDAIRAMRAALSAPGGAVRLLGLSGMGKTRLAEALFDEAIDPPSTLPRNRAIYGDAGLDLALSPALLTERIAASGVEAIIVVDNCSDIVHGQLTELVRRTGNASLLTIDYDASGEKTEGLVVVLGENSEEVLKALLKQRFPNLKDRERERLATFSGGNARVALKVAEAGDDGEVDLSKLQDNELVDRLFRTGRRKDDPALRAAADAASLVTAFYVEEGRGHAAEHPVLADIAELSVRKFFAGIATLLDWGVVQKRGPQRAVMPPPLANMLAAPAIRKHDAAVLIDHFKGGPPRLFSSFARRIGHLHNEPQAVTIAERLYADGGPLGDPTDLPSQLVEAFINAAPASPGAALRAIERALYGPDADRLLAPTKDRKALAELLVSIAHDPELFDRAIDVLAAFAKDDPDKGDNSVKSLLLERFWPRASRTMASLEMRMDTIDRMTIDPDPRLRLLGVEALGQALSTNQMGSSLRTEFGARSRTSEWRPDGDYRPWFETVYARLEAIANGPDPVLAEQARSHVARHFRAHLDAGLSAMAIPGLRAVAGNRYFERGWRAVNDALHFQERPDRKAKPDRRRVDAKTLDELKLIERELRPRKIGDLFETFTLGKSWSHWHPSGREKNPQRNIPRLSRAIGICVGRAGMDPAPFLARATVVTEGNSIWHFMAGLASVSDKADDLWKQAYILFADDPAQRSVALLGGILEGANRRRPEWVQAQLDTVADDPVLRDHIVTLHYAAPFDEAAVNRFTKALADGHVPLSRFSSIANGGVSKTIPGPALADYLRQLYARDEGVDPALDILHMRIYGDRGDKVPLDPALIAFGRDALTDPRAFKSEDNQSDHEVGEIGKAVLADNDDPELTRRIVLAMREASGEHYVSSSDYGELAALLTTRHPKVVFEEIAENPKSNGLLARFLGPLASNDSDSEDDPEEGIDAAMEWVAVAPQERATRLAGVVRYAVNDKETGKLRWSKIALKLIAAAPDPLPILNAFVNRFGSGAAWGPISLRFVRRKALAAFFRDHDDVQIRSWARTTERQLDEQIKYWDANDRGPESLFE